jgi:hypothetical protein
MLMGQRVVVVLPRIRPTVAWTLHNRHLCEVHILPTPLILTILRRFKGRWRRLPKSDGTGKNPERDSSESLHICGDAPGCRKVELN